MRLPDFVLHQPRSLAEAFDAAAEAGAGGFDFLAGGTDLLCNYKWHIHPRAHLISLRRVAELRASDPGELPAGRTLWELESDPRLRQRLPALAEAAAAIAMPLVRRSATLGGNLLLDTRCWHFNQSYEWRVAHGSCLKAEADACRVLPEPGNVCVATYCGDLAPVLLACGAAVRLAGPDGARTVALERFFSPDGIRRFRDKRPEEILVAVVLPRDLDEWTVAYRKLRLRESFDFPEGGVAAAVRWEDGQAAEVRLATTAYDSVPRLHPELAAPLVASRLEDEGIEAVAAGLEEAVAPVKNTSMSPAYRKKMARVLCRRALQACKKP